MPVRLQLSHFSKVKLRGAICSAPHLARAFHVVAGGVKFAGAEDAQASLENLNPTLLARFRVATAKQLVDNDTLFFPGHAKFPELPRDKAIAELLLHGIG